VGCKAHVVELRRERSGEFDVADAWQLDALIELSKEMGLGRPPRQRQQAREKNRYRSPQDASENTAQPQAAGPYAANMFREL
jgi:tRNA U55 pseudouridine synthase TruB